MSVDPKLLEFELKVRSSSQAINEAAVKLRNMIRGLNDADLEYRYSLRLNHYHLKKNGYLELKYEIIPFRGSFSDDFRPL